MGMPGKGSGLSLEMCAVRHGYRLWENMPVRLSSDQELSMIIV